MNIFSLISCNIFILVIYKLSLEPHLSYNMSSKSKRKSPDIRSFFQCGIRQRQAPSSKVDDLSNKKAKVKKN